MEKMTFREFLEFHASLMPAVNFAPGTSAFYDLLRAWNTIAILFPEKCENIVVWEKGSIPSTMKNDLDINEVRKTLSTKQLENLPDSLRSSYIGPTPKQQKSQPKGNEAAKPKQVPQSDPALNNLPPEVRDSIQNTRPTAYIENKNPELSESPEEDNKSDKEETHVPSHAKKTNEAKKESPKKSTTKKGSNKSPKVEV